MFPMLSSSVFCKASAPSKRRYTWDLEFSHFSQWKEFVVSVWNIWKYENCTFYQWLQLYLLTLGWKLWYCFTFPSVSVYLFVCLSIYFIVFFFGYLLFFCAFVNPFLFHISCKIHFNDVLIFTIHIYVICLCLSVYLSFHLSIYIVYLLINLSIYLSESFCLWHQYTGLLIYISGYLSVFVFSSL